ncbi:MAG TPA: hypothetical protein VM735_06725 [Candidatus Kapabacteria bacterium]|nr:hypothetical protein [Candidatus Kapabacteria bacterium]
MPDLGLFSATDLLPNHYKVVIKYIVEVEGLPVYTETYNVDHLGRELEDDAEKAARIWFSRICITRCLTDGCAANCGHQNSDL